MEYLDKTEGDVIEIGMGLFSTPFLHWYCKDRNLISYEDTPYWYEQLRGYESPAHAIVVAPYQSIEEKASIVFIDSFPVSERYIIANQFKDSMYVIVHDMDMMMDNFDFKYRKDYPENNTSVFSNKIDVGL